ncbi:MAG: signal peptidase II [Spirochaetales bacterium]|nr:signal peptidase II [Spirochaetales bacterium]MCF7938754.1 signal peptidase II [Spirochaetales bacterium]
MLQHSGRLRPFLLSLLIIAVDQITKLIIIKTIPMHGVAWTLGDDFLRIIHVRNLGIAFSIGMGASEVLRSLLFILLPLGVLIFIGFYMVRSRELYPVHRWSLAGILGGGFGNLVDRLFRPEGVVDFIDIKFFRFLGLPRWPAFNVADSAVVICGVILAAAFIFNPPDDLRSERAAGPGSTENE